MGVTRLPWRSLDVACFFGRFLFVCFGVFCVFASVAELISRLHAVRLVDDAKEQQLSTHARMIIYYILYFYIFVLPRWLPPRLMLLYIRGEACFFL